MTADNSRGAASPSSQLTALPNMLLHSCLIMEWKLSFSLSLVMDNGQPHLSTLRFYTSPASCCSNFFLHIIQLFTTTPAVTSRTFFTTTCMPSSLCMIINLVNRALTAYVCSHKLQGVSSLFELHHLLFFTVHVATCGMVKCCMCRLASSHSTQKQCV